MPAARVRDQVIADRPLAFVGVVLRDTAHTSSPGSCRHSPASTTSHLSQAPRPVNDAAQGLGRPTRQATDHRPGSLPARCRVPALGPYARWLLALLLAATLSPSRRDGSLFYATAWTTGPEILLLSGAGLAFVDGSASTTSSPVS